MYPNSYDTMLIVALFVPTSVSLSLPTVPHIGHMRTNIGLSGLDRLPVVVHTREVMFPSSTYGMSSVRGLSIGTATYADHEKIASYLQYEGRSDLQVKEQGLTCIHTVHLSDLTLYSSVGINLLK